MSRRFSTIVVLRRRQVKHAAIIRHVTTLAEYGIDVTLAINNTRKMNAVTDIGDTGPR